VDFEWGPVHTVALWAFGLALVLGAVAFKTNFCTMGAVSDWVNMGDKGRLRSWFLATGVAILGTQGLQLAGLIDTSTTIYQVASFGWLEYAIGGLLFGIGMTLASGCGQRTMVRVGGGNLKSLVVLLVFGITAFMTLRGLLAYMRIEIERSNVDLAAHGINHQGWVDAIMVWTGLADGDLLRIGLAAVLGLGLVWFAYGNREFRASFDNQLAGIVIGLIIVGGWYVTGVLGADDFEPVPPESMTFVMPVGNAINYFMTFTGSVISFGVAVIFGTIAGSFLYSVATRNFRIETFVSRQDMARHLWGGVCMGTGGVLGFGCTIGQGVTGMSTLSMGSVITLLFIILGSALTMKVDYYRADERGFFAALGKSLGDIARLRFQH
jgi:hypothetical protein